MIAMSMTSTCHKYRRERAGHPVPAHPVRLALLRALSMLGLGVGGMAAMDEDEPLGIG